MSALEKVLTFGGLLLSTVPVLLILLISGLVSWRIQIQMQKKVGNGKENSEENAKKGFVVRGHYKAESLGRN